VFGGGGPTKALGVDSFGVLLDGVLFMVAQEDRSMATAAMVEKLRAVEFVFLNQFFRMPLRGSF